VKTEDEGEAKKNALVLEIDQMTRERQAQERLQTNVKSSAARFLKEIEETRAAMETLEGESDSMNAYFSKMESEAADFKAQLDKEKATLEQLEGDEKSLQAQQDAVQAEHTAQLQEQEALLGALRELTDMRDGHAASLRGLKQMSQEDVVGDLVDQELSRLSTLATADQAADAEAAGKREAVLHAIKESETKFVEGLKQVRSKINAQKQTLERLDDYSKKVKDELQYATQQLLEHNGKRSDMEECINVLQQELGKLEKQANEIGKVVQSKKKDEQEKQQVLENEMLDLQQQVTDHQEQIEAEAQVLEGLEEYLARTKLQLQELDGSREDKGRFKTLEQCTATFGKELEAVKAENASRKQSLEELEQKEASLKEELEHESSRLAKEERDVAYKINVDLRAMDLKRGYTDKLHSDVKAGGAKIPDAESSAPPAPPPATDES
jgi:chromosome segregation ATPase